MDFSQFSTDVIRYAAALAERLHARLHLFHSICFPRSQLDGTAVRLTGEERRYRENHALEKLSALAADSPVPWTPFIAVGDPVAELTFVVTREDIDLVIAASYGVKGLRRAFMGTVIERLARNLPRPLLAVPSRPSPGIPLFPVERIVAACDLTPESKKTVMYALALAGRLEASVDIVHAVASPSVFRDMDIPRGPYSEIEEILTRKIAERIERWVPYPLMTRYPAKPVVLRGEAGERIAEYARQIRAQMIVIGVRRHGAFSRFLSGSATEMILRTARCPVLVFSDRKEGPS